jgi:hypothetical protein
LPFNNEIEVDFNSKSSVSGIQVNVYIRQRYYPNTIIIGDNTGNGITIGRFSNQRSLTFALDSPSVSSDLANYAELVFDFSSSVKGEQGGSNWNNA